MSAYFVFIGGNLISRSSNMKNIVACTYTELEYRALALVVAEIKWIKSLMTELGIRQQNIPLVYYDNVSRVLHSKYRHESTYKVY